MIDNISPVIDHSILALVATTTHLLLVDLQSKQTTIVEKDKPEYYGISWLPNSDSLVLSHSATDNSKLIDIEAYANSEVGYLSSGNIVSERFLSAPHQILCASDGRVICTNTGRNSITVVDLHKPGFFQEKRLSSARWDRLSLGSTTGDHLNSIFEKDGKVYVIVHGHSRGAALAVLSYPELEILEIAPIDGRTGLHNIWVTEDEQKISCHSSIGGLIDVESNKVIWQAGSPVYTRGLAATSNIVLVGESEITGRDLRRTSASGLWVLEKNSLKTLDYIYLGMYGAVNEVRLLNVPDLAHHGHIFNGYQNLLEDNYTNRLQASRVETAHRLLADNVAWSNYELVYGAPQRTESGKKRAEPDSLCLIVQKSDQQAINRSLKFNYEVNVNNPGAHLSVVIYQGAGGDDNMHAFLMQPDTNGQLKMSVWINDGLEWKKISVTEITGLPSFGEIEATVNAESFDLYVNEALQITKPSNSISMIEGSLGIRWSDSTVTVLNV
ncbi:hypothetical protein [Pseudomonas sp. PGPPP2]|uniref:hypothetical protein n=1 Tax=Pseudomonas sp. PGPPP2 TaxID=2015554 RepID=UPI00257BD0A5|nr:hypothetical protein [Pseudomonas sp. PGPPP2]